RRGRVSEPYAPSPSKARASAAPPSYACKPDSDSNDNSQASESDGRDRVPLLSLYCGATGSLEAECERKASEEDRRAYEEGDHSREREDAADEPDLGRAVAAGVAAPGAA